MRTSLLLGTILVIGATTACGGNDTYTLYRNGVAQDTLRIHVATFDADEEDDKNYNHDNCEQARELFQLHPAQVSRFWCEKGTYRKKPPKP
ncbi:MAG: hypothetical protein ABI664_20905 [bacterium]